MTIIYLGNGVYRGVAADTKPTTNVTTNSLFQVTDTGELYKYNGASWDLIIGASKSEVYTNKTLDVISNTVKNLGHYKYEVFTVSGTTYCRNIISGAIESSNADPTVVIQYAIDNVGRFSILLKAGTYLLTAKLNCIDKHFRLVGEGMILSGNAGTTGDTILKANYTGGAGTALIDCNNTIYNRQQFANLVIDCNSTVPIGILAMDVRERPPWLQNVAVVNASDIGIKASKVVYATCYNVIIANCTNQGLWLWDNGGGNGPNTFYMYGGRLTSNGINLQVDSSTDIGFNQVVMESGVTNCVKLTGVVAKQIRFRDCSFEWHPVTTTNIACDITATNVFFEGCRFDSNNTTYYPITVRATSKYIVFYGNLFQANNGSTTANITVESGALSTAFYYNVQDTNTPLTVSVTDPNASSIYIGNSFIQDKVASGLQLGGNKLWLKEVDANTVGLYASDGTTRKNFLSNAVLTSVIRTTGSSDMIDVSSSSAIGVNNKPITNMNYMELNAIAAPSTPAAGKGRIWYNTTDKHLYQIDDAGVSTDLTSGASGAPTTSQYVTLATDATLTNERVLAAGSTKVTITDGGAGNNVSVDVVEKFMRFLRSPDLGQVGISYVDPTALTHFGMHTRNSNGGTATYVDGGANGLYINYNTTTSTNTRAGTWNAGTNHVIARRGNPVFKAKVKFGSASAMRVQMGFSQKTAVATSDTLIATTDESIMLGYRTSDTNMQIVTCNGTTVTYTNTSQAVDTSFHTWELRVDDSSGTVTAYCDGSSIGSTTSTVPASDIYMSAICIIGNSTTTSKDLGIRYVYSTSEY